MLRSTFCGVLRTCLGSRLWQRSPVCRGSSGRCFRRRLFAAGCSRPCYLSVFLFISYWNAQSVRQARQRPQNPASFSRITLRVSVLYLKRLWTKQIRLLKPLKLLDDFFLCVRLYVIYCSCAAWQGSWSFRTMSGNSFLRVSSCLGLIRPDYQWSYPHYRLSRRIHAFYYPKLLTLRW